MQHPVGYRIVGGRAVMTDFWAVATNTYGWLKFGHTVLAGFVVGGFFVLGISAYHLLRDNYREFFSRSFRMAAVFSLVSSVLLFVVGDFHASHVAETQPAKFAAMESVWQTQRAAPYYLLVLPDEKNEKNAIQMLGIPKMLSFLAYHDFNAEVKGLRDIPKDQRPPVLITFLSFRGMIGLGMLFMALSLLALVVSRGWIGQRSLLLKVFLFSIPLPYIATQLGWVVAEVGRQPWLVYGLVRTSQGVSEVVSRAQIIASLAGFVLIYSLLAVVDLYLLVRFARKVPEEVQA
jgi:cytochrome d ubiquinol oxidase subunit I